jgi:hypothetical protein
MKLVPLRTSSLTWNEVVSPLMDFEDLIVQDLFDPLILMEATILRVSSYLTETTAIAHEYTYLHSCF